MRTIIETMRSWSAEDWGWFLVVVVGFGVLVVCTVIGIVKG